MHPNVIQFSCGNCGTQLTVPAQMAGVSGPCPKCGQTVVSPTPVAPDITGSMWGPAQLTQPLSKLTANVPPPANASPPEPGRGTATVPPPQNKHDWASSLGKPATQTVPQPQAQVPNQGRPPSQPLQPMSSAMILPPSFQGSGADALGVVLPPAVPQAKTSLAPGGGLPHAAHAGLQPPPSPSVPQLSQPPIPSMPAAAPSWAAPGPHPTGSLLNSVLTQSPVVPQTPVAPLSMPPDAARVQLPPQRMAQQPPASAFPQSSYNQPTPQVQLPVATEPQGFTDTSAGSRPMAVSGSRISLLARQLGTEEAGGNQPPPVAQPLSPEELKPASAMTGASSLPRAQPAPVGAALLPAAGRYPTAGKSHRMRNLAIAAILLLTGLGAAAYKFRPQLEAMFNQYSTEGLPPEEPLAAVPADTSATETAKINVDALDPSQPSSSTPSAPQPVMAKPEVVAQPETISAPPTTAPAEVPPTPPEQVAVAKMMPIELPPPAASKPEASLVEIGKTAYPTDASKSATAMQGSADESGLQFRDVPAEVKPAADALRNFLLAKTWEERMNYTLHPEKMLDKLKSYYQENTDGPVEVNLVEYLRHDSSPQIGAGAHVIFVLSGKSWPYSFPVMVEQNGKEARVDWLTFVEFKDDLLRHYLESDIDTPWSFHVELRRAHYFEDNVPNADKMDCFEILSVMGTAHAYAFVSRDSPLAKSLANTITWDKEVSYVVANLQWRTHANGKWLELVGLPQLNWYTAPDVATTSAPAAKPAEAAKVE